MNSYRISVAGAGRVGSAVCSALFASGFSIDLVVSESEDSCRNLALACKSSWSTELVFPDTTDIIIVSVPDHKIKSVLNSIKCRPSAIVAHTAGSFGLDIFPDRIIHKGVFYPLQTFSKGRNVNFSNIPLLLEASEDKTFQILESVAKSISSKVCFADSEHRKTLHLAAVFVNNFTNHLLTRGKEVALRGGYKFEILEPLIIETVSKAIAMGPENSQTGPAIRNDNVTMEKQFDLLSFSPELQTIYKEMTQSIIKYYKSHN